MSQIFNEENEHQFVDLPLDQVVQYAKIVKFLAEDNPRMQTKLQN